MVAKGCSVTDHKAYYQQHKQELIEKSQAWYRAHRAERSAQAKANYRKNRIAVIARSTAYAATHKEERKSWLRKWLIERRFNKTLEWFETQLQKQNGCAICHTHTPGGRFNQWHIDHDHKCCPERDSCGKCVRGILCAACNFMLGAINDKPETLRSAAAYLEEHPNG